jgi:hypothetical protein
MRRIVIVLFASVAAASAQPSTEHVTVTGTRARPVIDGFVQAFVKPARMTGKFARWEDRICPVTVGLRPAATSFVTHRVKQIAAQAGAPVNDSERCRANIAIVFTTHGQALLDDIRKRRPEILGYYDNNSQRDALVVVNHPIQAWYTTATKDLRGNADLDNAKGGGVEITIQDPVFPNLFITMAMPHAHSRNVTGSRLGDGTRSVFDQIIIVADPTKLADYEIGALADYISLLALTQLDSLDICQALPSIVNLLSQGCAQKPNALTENDLAYLRGLYKMGPDRTSRIQQDEIAYQMEQVLNGK